MIIVHINLNVWTYLVFFLVTGLDNSKHGHIMCRNCSIFDKFEFKILFEEIYPRSAFDILIVLAAL